MLERCVYGVEELNTQSPAALLVPTTSVTILGVRLGLEPNA
jgi:hypothetical protein